MLSFKEARKYLEKIKFPIFFLKWNKINKISNKVYKRNNN